MVSLADNEHQPEQEILQRQVEKENKKTLLEVFQLGRVQLELHAGDITKIPADIIASSANNWLLHGSGSARAISDSGGFYSAVESRKIMKSHLLNGNLRTLPLWANTDLLKGFFSKLSYVQAISLHYLLQQPIDSATGLHQPLSIGSIRISRSFDLRKENIGEPKFIIYLVGMGYEAIPVAKGRYALGRKIPTSYSSIFNCLNHSLQFLQNSGSKSFSLPLLGASKGGFEPVESAVVIATAVKEYSRLIERDGVRVKMVLSDQLDQLEKEKILRSLDSIGEA